MKEIKTENAVGMYYAMILRRSSKTKRKCPFQEGHIVKEEDIPLLLSVGKDISMYGKSRKVFF